MNNAALIVKLKARIEELEAKLYQSNIAEFCGIAIIESMTAKELHHVFGELSEKAKESNQGLADKARLDWLDQVNASSNEKNGTVYGWRFDINHNRAALTDCNHPALDIRQAIDAAIESKRASDDTALMARRKRVIDDMKKLAYDFASSHEDKLNSIEGCKKVSEWIYDHHTFKAMLNEAVQCGAIERGTPKRILSYGNLEIAVLIK